MYSNSTREKKERQRRGFTIIEIVLAVSMLMMALLSITTYYKKILDVSQDTTRHIQSGFLLEEEIEGVKMLRDAGWSTNILALSTSTTYYLYWNNTSWVTTTTPQVVEGLFTRSFKLSDVFRNASDNIASSGTYDRGTKKLNVSVVWRRKNSISYATDTAETYITDIFAN
jgi:type II secretory pathway pseudopilin PulG